MSIYSNFLRRLSPVISTQTQVVPAIQIASLRPLYLQVANDRLYLSNGDDVQVNLSLWNYTLSSLVDAINNVFYQRSIIIGGNILPETDVFLAGDGNISAALLLEGTYTDAADITLYADISDNAVLLKSMARVLQTAFQDMQNGTQQLNPYNSSGIWLDYFGEIMGIPRYQGEPDQLYANRIVNLKFGIRDNNIAIQDFFAKMGYQTQAVDTGPGSGVLYVTLPKSPPTGFAYSLAQLQDMLNALKPLGVQITVFLSGGLTDTTHISDSLSVIRRSKPWTWGNFVWGQFNW